MMTAAAQLINLLDIYDPSLADIGRAPYAMSVAPQCCAGFKIAAKTEATVFVTFILLLATYL